jgi:hypothetical protein
MVNVAARCDILRVVTVKSSLFPLLQAGRVQYLIRNSDKIYYSLCTHVPVLSAQRSRSQSLTTMMVVASIGRRVPIFGQQDIRCVNSQWNSR